MDLARCARVVDVAEVDDVIGIAVRRSGAPRRRRGDRRCPSPRPARRRRDRRAAMRKSSRCWCSGNGALPRTRARKRWYSVDSQRGSRMSKASAETRSSRSSIALCIERDRRMARHEVVLVVQIDGRARRACASAVSRSSQSSACSRSSIRRSRQPDQLVGVHLDGLARRHRAPAESSCSRASTVPPSTCRTVCSSRVALCKAIVT